MKVIFLDIDGVLNYEGYGRVTSTGARFVDPVLIKKLKKIIDCTGAKVVLSSTWRKGIYDMREGKNDTTDARDVSELITELKKYGVEIFAVTPMLGMVLRGDEIRAFLSEWRGEEIDKFVIIDDIPIMYPYNSVFVNTDYRKGITDSDVERAIAILGSIPAKNADGATVIVEDGLKDIPDEYFFEDQSIEKVFLPDTIECVGKRAFGLCKNLKEVYLPDKAISFGKEVFKGCESLKYIVIPNGTKVFGTELFADCTALKGVRLPEGLRYIPYGTFYNCVSLEKLVLPDSVELIGKNVFHGCASIKEIVIPPKVDRLDELTFYGCKSLKRIYVGTNLQYLKKSAFMNCPSLTEIIVYQK